MFDCHGFILSRQWRDTRHGVELEFWVSTSSGPAQLLIPNQQVVFFLAVSECAIADSSLAALQNWSRKSVAMQTFSLEPVCAYYFDSQRTLREAREILLAKGLSPLESDINPYDRFLMEHFVRGSIRARSDEVTHKKIGSSLSEYQKVIGPSVKASDYYPDFKVLSVDIECAMEGLSLYSIGLYAKNYGLEFSKVFMVSQEPVGVNVEVYSNEKKLMAAFLDWLEEYDPDIIIGWNVVNFDMWFLQRICEKIGLPFRFGRGRSNAHWRVLDDEGERRAISVPGRVVLDGIELLKTAAYRFESFSLNNVANVLLDDGKLLVGSDRGEKITELFLHDKQKFVDYNIKDCKLVVDIFEKTNLLQFAIARSQLTGLPLDRVGGSVASFDFRYLPLLHRQAFVAPNSHLKGPAEASPGGFVMNSQPGIFDHVLVLDFKSLYPSIIRSFKIDPMGMAVGLESDLDQSELVPGFRGAWFAKEGSLLPQIITELWASRDQAKANNDDALSHAIKIMMNSFYGVLGASGCRFFDSRLASSITLRGHQIIQETAAFIENESPLSNQCSVIYGDTDSVFVWLKEVTGDAQALALGKELERQLNIWWRNKLEKDYGLESALEIEFETHFKKFLMPTIRGSDQGSKKRYAGVVDDNGKAKLVFKGLENVRTDWTKLAREFQLELYRRVFFNEPYRDFVKDTVKQVMTGLRDEELTYRKRLRRKLEDYQKNIPPHVQAARKVSQSSTKLRRGDWIEYVITVNGAEPVDSQTSLIDYQHYVDRQLAPAADGILYFLGDSLDAIIDQQLGLFE
ncbi:MAG: DNA polymerase-2 [Oceanicoccus sp.]|jgi:DNA polymerase-2